MTGFSVLGEEGAGECEWCGKPVRVRKLVQYVTGGTVWKLCNPCWVEKARSYGGRRSDDGTG